MTIKEELALVCKNKESVVKLSIENLRKYKTNFYSLNKGIISDFSCKKDKKMI